MADRFDVVAVRIEDEGPKVARVVLGAKPGTAVVATDPLSVDADYDHGAALRRDTQARLLGGGAGGAGLYRFKVGGSQAVKRQRCRLGKHNPRRGGDGIDKRRNPSATALSNDPGRLPLPRWYAHWCEWCD